MACTAATALSPLGQASSGVRLTHGSRLCIRDLHGSPLRVAPRVEWHRKGCQVAAPRRASARRLANGVRAQALEVATQGAPTAEEQQRLVAEVATRLAAEHPGLPTGRHGRDDGALLLWFLKDRKFNVDATVGKAAKAIQWRADFQVSSLTDASVAEQAATGKAYLHDQLDCSGRPVIVVTAAKHFAEKDPQLAQRLCVHLIQKAVDNMPAGEEQILGIFDLRGFTAGNADWGFVKFFINLFFNYYPKRLGEVLFVEAPFIFRQGWNIVKPMLKSYARLVRFCDAEDVRKEYFTPETIPHSFK